MVLTTFQSSLPCFGEEETNRGSIDPELRISLVLSEVEPFTCSLHPNFRHQPVSQFEKQDFPLGAEEKKVALPGEERERK